MKRLYFVRHALSEMNKEGKFSGRTNTPLAPEGFEQAAVTATEVKALTIDLIVSSPMERCRETAVIIAKAIGYPLADILIKDLFMERELGVLEGTTYVPATVHDTTEGVETTEEILNRARQGIAYLQSLDSDTILLVSHSAIGRAIRHVLHPQIPYRGSESFENAKIVQLL